MQTGCQLNIQSGMHEKNFIPNNYINITGEQVIDQSEKNDILSIFDYLFHLAKTMNTLILFFQRFNSNFVVGKRNPSQRPKLNNLILFGYD